MERIETLVYFESLMLCLVLLVVLFIANIRYWRPRIFNRLSIIYMFVALTIIFYGIWSFVDGNKELVWVNKLMTLGASISMTLACMFYYYYVLKNVGLFFRNAKFWYISSFFAIGGSTALYIISLWTGTAFYVDADGFYQRGVLFFGDLIASYAYILCGVIFALVRAHRAEFLSERHKFLTIATAIIPCVILGVVNNVIPYPYGLPIVFYGIVISLLIIFTASTTGRVTKDSLTGLNNRHAFDTMLIKASKKRGPTDLYLFICDINGFKGINDTYGHTVGDEVLIRLSATLENVAEEYKAVVGRWGGDEFVAYLEANDERTANEFASSLKARIFTECNTDPRFIVSISIGWSKLREFESMKHFFDEADHKLYEDKKKFHQLNG